MATDSTLKRSLSRGCRTGSAGPAISRPLSALTSACVLRTSWPKPSSTPSLADEGERAFLDNHVPHPPGLQGQNPAPKPLTHFPRPAFAPQPRAEHWGATGSERRGSLGSSARITSSAPHLRMSTTTIRTDGIAEHQFWWVNTTRLAVIDVQLDQAARKAGGKSWKNLN